MHLFAKVNRMQVVPQQKYHINRVGGMLGDMQDVGRWCDHKDLHGHLENYINQGGFQPGRMKQKGFTEV